MIGVCIKYFHENYGGMLQAYATIKMLENRGLKYELIRYKKKHTVTTMIRFIPRLLNGVLVNDKKEAFLKKIGLQKHPELAKNEEVRRDSFKKFNENHFTQLSPVYIGYDALCEGAKRYSAVVTGSDQLWSPAGLPTNYYNLMFVPNSIRKISYASSFGVKKIPWYQKKRTKNFLQRIDYISMRENHGSEIVKELIGRNVPTILDPVFMFDKEEWEKLVPVEREYVEPYIFAYFLGDNTEHRETVKKLSKSMGMKIVTLRHLDQYVEIDDDFGDFAPYDVSPGRFLNLLRGAEFVCTDSFHGTCFSIIHQKKFLVFNRYSEKLTVSKNSRIDSLCENLGLQCRRYIGQNILNIQKEIDYNTVYKRLGALQKLTQEYLDEAFKGID